jgi:hypothetical protein
MEIFTKNSAKCTIFQSTIGNKFSSLMVIDLVVYRANRARYICDHETVEAAPKFVMTSKADYGQLRPRLGWLPIDAIKKTFEHTTQLARMPMSSYYTQETVQVSESCLERASS